MKVPVPIPRHLWKRIMNVTWPGTGIFLWRAFLTLAFVIGVAGLIAATGGAGLVGIAVLFLATSAMSHFLRDDILAVWRDLWNARWGEVEI